MTSVELKTTRHFYHVRGGGGVVDYPGYTSSFKKPEKPHVYQKTQGFYERGLKQTKPPPHVNLE
jgi:hypothetical protein